MSLESRLAEDAKEYPPIEGGHAWIRDAGGTVDFFRLEAGYHNGPECARCHESFCQHCNRARITEQCPEFGSELPGLELGHPDV